MIETIVVSGALAAGGWLMGIPFFRALGAHLGWWHGKDRMAVGAFTIFWPFTVTRYALGSVLESVGRLVGQGFALAEDAYYNAFKLMGAKPEMERDPHYDNNYYREPYRKAVQVLTEQDEAMLQVQAQHQNRFSRMIARPVQH